MRTRKAKNIWENLKFTFFFYICQKSSTVEFLKQTLNGSINQNIGEKPQKSLMILHKLHLYVIRRTLYEILEEIH